MNSKWKLYSVALSALIIIIGLYGCKKHDLSKVAGTAWNPNLAVPIGYADFGVYDVLANADSNDLVISNTDGSLALYYTGEIASVDAASVIVLNDYSQQYNLTPPSLGLATTGSFGGTISSTNNQNFDFPTQSGVELHTLNFESGTLNLNVSTTLQHDITLVVTFTDLESNNVAITRTINLNYSGSLPQTAVRTIDLTNVSADFTAGGTTVNRIRVDVDATITGTNQPILGTEALDLSVSMTNMKFKNATGYFGQQVLGAASDSILLKIFNNATTGTFAFTNPSLKFIVENSFGIPIDINFSDLESINIADGQISPLTGFPSNLSINTPTTFGQTVSTSLLLNTSNTTNMTSIISPTPKYLNYTIAATSNPNGNVLPLNFIESTSKFVVKAELGLPMEGYASGFTARDTMPFSYGGDVNNLESVMFRFNINNGFPVAFAAQVTFVDENFNPLFTLFDAPEKIIEAASVNSAGKVTTSTTKVSDITIQGSKILLLNNAKHVIITGVAETTQPQGTVVKFYDSYRIGLKLGMQAQLKAN